MDKVGVWRAIDDERSRLADLMEGLSDAEWRTPSLCAGWTVRDVAAHLTLAHLGVRAAHEACYVWSSSRIWGSSRVGRERGR
jgi:uncharacterized protein (TIGR03083 family)